MFTRKYKKRYKQKTATLRCKQSNFVAKNKNKEVIHIVLIRALCNYASVWSTTGILSFVMISIIYNLKWFVVVLFQCAFMNRLLAASAWPNLVTPRTAPPTSIMSPCSLQNTAGYCKIMQNTAEYCKILQNTAEYCQIMLYTAIYCNSIHLHKLDLIAGGFTEPELWFHPFKTEAR